MNQASAQTVSTTETELALEAFGVSFTVEFFDPALVDRVRALLPYGTVPATAQASIGGTGDEPRENRFALVAEDGDVFRVLLDTNEMLACHDLELSLFMLSALVHDLVAYRATSGIFVRGAAVLYAGRAILIVGPALSGRSTVVGALVRAGAAHWCDQYVVLDGEGLVHRFGETSAQLVADRGDVSAQAAVPLGMVVVTEYRPGATWDPQIGTEGDAMLAVLEQAVPTYDRAAQTMSVVRTATAGAIVLQGERGEAAEVAGALIEAAANTFAA